MADEKDEQEQKTGPIWKKKVDSDWKKKVAAEKQKLEAEEKARGGKAGAGATSPAFLRFIQGLGAQALAALGEMPDPMTGQRGLAPEAAQQLIDILSMLEQKTAGNLSQEEADLLGDLLHTLRMRFVEVARTAMSRGGPGGGGPRGPGRPGGPPPGAPGGGI